MYETFAAIFYKTTCFKVLDKLSIFIKFTGEVYFFSLLCYEYQNIILSSTLFSLNLPDECISMKLRVAVNRVCFHLVTQFHLVHYI